MVASLIDANNSDGVGSFKATGIDWGDGTVPDFAAFVGQGTGNFTAWGQGSHAYASAGTFNVTVSFTDGNGATAVAHSTAVVLY